MDVERLIERLAVIADTSFLDHAAADDLREAASALAKLQADNKAWEVALNSERELWNTISDQLEASVAKLQAERDEAHELILGPAAWLDRWADHVGACAKGDRCTCGLTLAQHEIRAASRALGGGE